ncbi:MAG: DUF6660 family protein [Ferruginibacter sp.]
MKFFAFIMAMMVLTLGGMPCMDEPYVNDQGSDKIQVSSTNDTTGHSDTDACSPFCTCNCCFSGFTVIAAVTLNSFTIPATAKIYASYLPSTVIEISLPVWQPPQLS